jgi:hypothetical protein
MPNINLPSLAGDATKAQCFKSHFIGNGPEEAADFSWQDVHHLGVVFRQHLLMQLQVISRKGKKTTQEGSS